jgi:glutamine amidotransferase-like uncharacterized protein
MGIRTWQYKSDKGGKSTRIMICGDDVWMHQNNTGEYFNGNSIFMRAKTLRKLLKRYK